MAESGTAMGRWGRKQRRKRPERERRSGVACDTRDVRYRDWDCLRFWFRSVEQNAPWVHKIYFWHRGHVPKWLNGNHPKLEIVRHEDYIPGEFLPTFNSPQSNSIFSPHPGLSEQFVYFNDDMFSLRKAGKPGQFFRDGKPLDMLCLAAGRGKPRGGCRHAVYLSEQCDGACEVF